jgi:release factor glutamine methyltransferase
MKALSKIRTVSETLSRHGIEFADKESQLIVKHSLALDLAAIYRDNPEVKDERVVEIDGMVARRIRREPLHYILGHLDFLGVRISLGGDVLIPRPETEMMVEYAVKVVRGRGSGVGGQVSPQIRSSNLRRGDKRRMTILDLCTGSGCIALALAREFPGSQVYGIDISEAAIGYAQKNALENNISNVTFLCGSMYDAVKGSQLFDLIISNPPYIPSSDINDLQPEIRQWEPRTALDGGADGLDAYRSIIPRTGNFLKNHGILILELGIGLARPVSGMAETAGLSGIEITKDLAGIERIFRAEWIK